MQTQNLSPKTPREPHLQGCRAHLGSRDPLIQLGYPETSAPDDLLLGETKLHALTTPQLCCGHTKRVC